MFQTAHDFVISSSTTLDMAEHLLALLNTVVQNLPESELRRIRKAIDQSVTLADDLLCNIRISSAFEMVTTNDASTTLGVGGPIRSTAGSRTPYRVAARIPTKTAASPSLSTSVANGETISEATVREHDIAVSVRPRVGRPHSAFFELGPFIILTDTSAPKQSHTPQDSRVSRTNL